MNVVAQATFCAEAGPEDAVFVANGAQIRHLQQVAKPAFEQARILPLSLHAYGAALRAEHPRVFDYRPLVDYPSCAEDYHRIFPQLSRVWLSDIGLRCKIDGVDLAELDAPAQFQFFLHAQHIARLAERIVLEHSAVRHFYVVAGDPLAPLDFYFDSDVTAAVVQYVCDRLKRPLRTIIASPRPDYLPAPSPPEADPNNSGLQIELGGHRPRVGFVTATLRNLEMFYSAFDDLRFDAVLFGSELWGMPPRTAMKRTVPMPVIAFSTRDASRDGDIAGKLRELRNSIERKIAASSLPACIRDNRHLDFQIDHIVMKRWLGYARLIRQAVEFVREHPLDLLIRSDHFTAEGAVLSHLYRKAGTPVMTVPHSSWPVDLNWRSPRHTDFALAWSKSSARRLAQLDPRTRICTVGDPVQDTFRRIYPYDDDNDSLRTITQSVRGKKVVLLLTNALEVHTVPTTDPVAYFDTCAVLANIPAGLRDRVAILVRPKPGAFGEDPILYETLSGFLATASLPLTSIGFDDCLRIADCVVGVNVPTSGYWDVLRNEIPLIHLQTSGAVALHPDLPAEVVGCVTESARIWDVIAAALFDETYRRQLIERQRAFFEDDHRPDRSFTGMPLQDVLRIASRPTRARRFAALSTRWRAALRRAFSTGTPSASVPPDSSPADSSPAASAAPASAALNVNDLVLTQTVTAGYVDEVRVSSDGRTIAVGGWAAALTIGQPAARVHAFVDGVHCCECETAFDRPDVVAGTNDPRILTSGFWLRFAADPAFELSKLAVYGELPDGTFFTVTPPRARGD